MAREELRRFGLVVGTAFLAMGIWWLYRERFVLAAGGLALLGAALVGLGALAPDLLLRPYRSWMAMASVLSFVMTRVILAIVFFLAVTPIGIIMRIAGLDPLRRRSGSSESYWREASGRQRNPRHFEKMY